MKTILMCEPQFYDVEYVINPWMENNIHHVNKNLAKQQWTSLYNIVKTYAHVKLIQGQQNLPDLVFTANAGLVINKTFIPSRFKNQQRVGEQKVFEQWFDEQNYSITAINDGIIFEGAGDCLKGKNIYWCGYNFRTSRQGAIYISHIIRLWFDSLCYSIKLVDERFYHFDTCFCPLNDESVMLYRPAIEQNDFCKIVEVYGEDNIIEVNEEDAVNFACNAVNIDNVIIVNNISKQLKTQLNQRGFKVIETPMTEFIKSGGSCKCLTLEI